MKRIIFTISADAVKLRKVFAPKTRVMKDKTRYDRKREKAVQHVQGWQ